MNGDRRNSIRALALTLAAFLALLLSSAIARADDTAGESAGTSAPNLDTITLRDLEADVYFLASDEMRGRETLKPEADLAAAYIAGRLHRAGVQPAGEDGSWYQTVRLAYDEYVETPELRVTQPGGADLAWTAGEHLAPVGDIGSFALEDLELVFAGYAVRDPANGWDDLVDLDVRGKAVLILRYEPTSLRKADGFAGWSRNSFLQTKARVLREAGAAAILMVTGPHSAGGVDNAPLPSLEGVLQSPPLRLADKPEAEQTPQIDLPFFQISLGAADALLGSEGATGHLQEAWDDRDRSAPAGLAGARISFRAEARTVVRESRNVAGGIEGEIDEWVVLGGHYDHLGLGWFAARDEATAAGQVHNGADDNASGIAAMLEIAEAFAAEGVRPKRGFLFLAFTGEEKGLLGSSWYARSPLIEHSRCVAMVNLDMIGRVRENRLEVHGVACSEMLERIVLESAAAVPTLNYVYSKELPAPQSDHWAFYKEGGLPVLFPFGGFNREMHTALDDPETINYGGLREAARFTAEVLWRLSRAEGCPDYRGPNKDSVGPDGRPRDPGRRADLEEREEEFSLPPERPLVPGRLSRE